MNLLRSTSLSLSLSSALAVSLTVSLVLGFAALSGGCASAMRTPESMLEEHLREFHGHVRWGRYAEAAAYVAPEERQTFLGMHAELGEDYQVTEYELGMVTLDRASDMAQVSVWMQWFRLPNTRVESATYDEVWRYDSDSRTWQLAERVRR